MSNEHFEEIQNLLNDLANFNGNGIVLMEEIESHAEAMAKRIADLESYIRFSQPCQHHGSAVARAGMKNDDPVFGGDDEGQ